MSLEQKVDRNTSLIDGFVSNSKKIPELPPLVSLVDLQDKIAMYKQSTGETLYVTIDQLRDGGAVSSSVSHNINLSFSADKVTKGDIHNIFGGLKQSVTAQPLSNGVDIVGTHGRSKLMIVINAGSDFNGTLTVTGKKIDRNTGAETPGFSEDIIIDSLSVDSSSVDGLGNNINNFINSYITSEWFADGFTISTTDLNLSDVDVYGVAFEQFNGAENLVIDTLDLTASVSNSLAEFSGHAYHVEVTGSKVNITSFADMEDPAANIEVGFYRYRLSGLNKSINTASSGIFIDMNFMPFIQSYYSAISFNLWAKSSENINVVVDGSLALDSIVYGETLQAGELVYLKSDGKYWKADNTSEATCTTELRLIIESGLADDEKLALAQGQYTGSGFTAGLEYVGVNGAITSTRPLLETETARIVSTSINATTRYFDPSKTWVNGTVSKINGIAISGASAEVVDNIFKIVNAVNQTRKVKFDLSGITNNTERTLGVQDKDGVIALLSDIIAANSANKIGVDTTNFDKNLSDADDTVQKALETLDELITGGGGGSVYGTRVDMGSSFEIDWTNPNEVFLKTIDSPTPFTDVNLPTGTNVKNIRMYLLGASPFITPSYWVLRSSSYDVTKINRVEADCIIGDSGSELVYYTVDNVEDTTNPLADLLFTIDTNLGVSPSFVVPVDLSETYNYTVDFGDGTILENQTGSASHTYSTDGIYQISIKGTFPKFYFNNSGDKLKLKTIDQWGNTQYALLQTNAFYGCSNLESIANDCDWLNTITGARNMFRACSGSIVDGLELPVNLVMDSLTDGYFMFETTKINTGLLPVNIGLNALTNGLSMFKTCQLTGLPNNMVLGNLINGSGMFTNNSFTDLSNTQLTFANLLIGDSMFFFMGTLTKLPNTINLSNATSLNSMMRNVPIRNSPMPNLLLTSLSGSGGLNFANSAIFETADYTRILIDADANNPNDNVTLHMGTTKYSASASTARANLVARGWVLNDGGLE